MVVKALACGISYEDIPKTPIAAIQLGWEAQCLLIFEQSKPTIQAQLAKLSPVSLAKAEAEPESDDEKKYGKRGREILERITNETYWKFMPPHMQAAWVRKHGWPFEAGKSFPIQGLSKTLAADIVALGESGRVAESAEYWAAFRKIRARLYKTIKE